MKDWRKKLRKLMSSNALKAVSLAIACTIFTSIGQILWKFGLVKIQWGDWLTFLNLPFVFGFVAYGIGALLMLLAFKQGELSLTYPIIAASYVWVSLLSPYFFPSDVMNGWKWAGVILILISVSLLGWGSTRNHNAGIYSTVPAAAGGKK